MNHLEEGRTRIWTKAYWYPKPVIFNFKVLQNISCHGYTFRPPGFWKKSIACGSRNLNSNETLLIIFDAPSEARTRYPSQVKQGIDILPLHSWGHRDKESFSKHRAWISHSRILCSTQDRSHSLLTYPNMFLTVPVFVSDAHPPPIDIYFFSASHGTREAGKIELAWR